MDCKFWLYTGFEAQPDPCRGDKQYGDKNIISLYRQFSICHPLIVRTLTAIEDANASGENIAKLML